MIDDLLLFSVDGTRAVEVTQHSGLEFATDIVPLFESSKVLKPVPVMVEGTYHIFDATHRSWKAVEITAKDISEYLANTPRDVAINYEHQRNGAAKGWLRLKDTARIGTIETRKGPKMALFAAIELFEQAANDVKRGLFRDVSIELKPVSKEILGTALTSYPVMRDVQFYANTASQVVGNGAEGVAESSLPDGSEIAVMSAATGPTPATASNPPPLSMASGSDTPVQEHSMDEALKTQALTEALQQFGLTPEDLAQVPNLLQTLELQKRELAFSHAKARVQDLVKSDAGELKLAPGALIAAAQLYAFCEQHAAVQFSHGDEQLSPAQLFEQVIKGVQAVQVFGATITEEGDLVADIQADPSVGKATEAYDPQRAQSLAEQIKARLQALA
jgi:hypothetical protein